MSTVFTKSLLGLTMVVAAASCATAPRAPEVAPGAVEVPHEWEAWPPAEERLLPAVPRAALTGKEVRLLPKPDGWTVRELFDNINSATGISILYDSTNATYKATRIEFVGAHVVDESRLFDWLQAVLSYRHLVLVPVGPKSMDGRQQWFVMDQADPSLKSRPTYIDESQVFDYADRDGLYVVTALRVRDTVDATRVRNALSPLSTATAGIGRIQDMGGAGGSRYLIVGDFAPVVAAMKRVLDVVNAGTPPSAAVQRAAPAAPAAKTDK